jgi:UBX domain-containing protein 7
MMQARHHKTPELNFASFFVVTEFLETKSNQKTPSTKRPKVVSDMTEEEQLNAAIAASLGNSHAEGGSGSGAADSPVTETQETEVDEETAEEEQQASIVDTIEANKREEPTDLKTSTRIQFRLAGINWILQKKRCLQRHMWLTFCLLIKDGSRIVRRFNKTDPVRYVFEFVKAEIPDANTRPFEVSLPRQRCAHFLPLHSVLCMLARNADLLSLPLQLIYNRRQLIDLIDKDIKEAGLENAAVNFNFS